MKAYKLLNNNKFLFDLNNFDTDAVEEVIIEEEIEITPPAPTFSEDDLEAAKAVAHATGRNEGMQEERQQRDQIITATLQQISENFSSLFAAEIYRERQYEEETLKLALEIIQHLAPSLQSKLGKESLKDELKEVLKTQSEQSEIKVEVHPETATDIDKLIEDIWPDKDSAPRYKILANTSLEKGACSLSWKDGGMVRDPLKIAKNMQQAIESLMTHQVLEGQSEDDQNSSLTDRLNNDINKEQSSDSLENTAKDNPIGEKDNG